MSIASDLRSYADNAAASVQAQLNDVSGQATELYGKTKENVTEIANKATGAVSDLRASAEKAINLDAIKTAVEPYLAQVKDYTASVTDRVESLVNTVKQDERVAKLVDAAKPVVDAAKPVVDVVQERVVKQVQTLTGRSTTPAKPAAKAATRPASTKPAAAKPSVSKPASKPAARKAPAKRTSKA
jgi:uncharacterized phage infection (PIP) family protein YhgE